MELYAFDEMRERLLEEDYFVIDFLPRQVSAERGRTYFTVERFMASHPQIDELYHRFALFLVKLSCYYDLTVYNPYAEKWDSMPNPEELVQRVTSCAGEGRNRYLHIIIPEEDSLLTLDGDDLYMTIYHAGEELLDTLKQLSAGAGLFLWRPVG